MFWNSYFSEHVFYSKLKNVLHIQYDNTTKKIFPRNLQKKLWRKGIIIWTSPHTHFITSHTTLIPNYYSNTFWNFINNGWNWFLGPSDLFKLSLDDDFRSVVHAAYVSMINGFKCFKEIESRRLYVLIKCYFCNLLDSLSIHHSLLV